jgi:hypothetical protein
MSRFANVINFPVGISCPIPEPTNLAEDYMVARAANDRRVCNGANLPYITEEGLVLIDRRDHKERRAWQCKH